MGYVTDSAPWHGLIEVEKLTLVLLYDDRIRGGQCTLRLAGYAGSRVPWGVHFGGRTNCRFLKDLMLQPVASGQGYRLDLSDDKLLWLALGLERQLSGHPRSSVRARPLLPRLWAGFLPGEAAGISGDGPELFDYASRIGRAPARVLEHLRRDHQGLAIFPLSWVSHHWQQAAAIFADLRHFPHAQVFRLRQHVDLAGFQDASQFDFVGLAGGRRGRRPRGRRRRRLSRRRKDCRSCFLSLTLFFRRDSMCRILLINNDGGGFADYVEVAEGTTVQQLFAERVPHGRPQDYLIRVNRQPVPADQVLQEGDRVSLTPTKIEGAKRGA